MRILRGIPILALFAAPASAVDFVPNGFVEYALAGLASPGDDSEFALDEARVQVGGELYGDRSEARFAVDLVADRVSDEERVDLRSAFVRLDLFDRAVELRAGRQPLTWGTGDLLFINDLFPKDQSSFFAGREDEYLKLPSDAVRLTAFPGAQTIDLVWTPRFAPDRLPEAARFDLGGPAPEIAPVPGRLRDGEWALRIARPFASWKLTAYGYHGRWKTPAGLDLSGAEPRLFHPRLLTAGGSARGTLRGGVAWLEFGRTLTQEDAGPSVQIPGDEWRLLAGYERSWWRDGTLGAQLQSIERDDADASRLATLRLTQLLRDQTVTASLFAFWSPDDGDGHLRASLGHQLDAGVALTVGAHLFFDGEGGFAPLADSDLLFARARMSY